VGGTRLAPGLPRSPAARAPVNREHRSMMVNR
jgi:hypothetical protein